ncbi:hypothetical protein Enr8_15300 [Blastopirellula retiformator]|uniref:Uncharacterized protein n=1 Tax=Blastopirellula retiformator TaxID=2527970 RepID=A0A5C5V8G2_9BACT|nr:hypothetical protein Enr8_15300 [Blastopirellula retiformator]
MNRFVKRIYAYNSSYQDVAQGFDAQFATDGPKREAASKTYWPPEVRITASAGY